MSRWTHHSTNSSINNRLMQQDQGQVAGQAERPLLCKKMLCMATVALLAGLMATAAVAQRQTPGKQQDESLPRPPARKVAPGARQLPPPMLRSLAVLEWTGEAGKPSASRVVPISIFDGQRYQDGGVYLARPEPLSVEPQTEYLLMHGGVEAGMYDVVSAQQLDGIWYGYGSWRPMMAPPPEKKLKPSKTLPHEVKAADDGTPHFAHRPKDESAPATSSGTPAAAGSGTASKPSAGSTVTGSTGTEQADDPDRPKLHRRDPSAASSDSGSQASSSNKTDSAGGPSSGSQGQAQTANQPQAPDDPDRPKLRRRPPTSASMASGSPNEAATGLNTTPGDRPKLQRGKPAVLEESPKLLGAPVISMEQIVAISDPTDRAPHRWDYRWNDRAGEAAMKAALEQLARELLATAPAGAGQLTSGTGNQAKGAKGSRVPTKASAAATGKAVSPPLALADEQYAAYELSYGAGATLVLTAHTPEEGSARRWVAVVAQPDLYGKPHVVFEQVTDAVHLDVKPAMRLVDAADADADNRAELILQLKGNGDRRFAIYKVLNGSMEQVFVTAAMP